MIMFWEKVGRLYDNAEAALWATLLAFVIYSIVFIIPKVPDIRARSESVRAQEIAAENEFYCEKFGGITSACLILGNFERRSNSEFTTRASFRRHPAWRWRCWATENVPKEKMER
jgi:hypothetical protein